MPDFNVTVELNDLSSEVLEIHVDGEFLSRIVDENSEDRWPRFFLMQFALGNLNEFPPEYLPWIRPHIPNPKPRDFYCLLDYSLSAGYLLTFEKDILDLFEKKSYPMSYG